MNIFGSQDSQRIHLYRAFIHIGTITIAVGWATILTIIGQGHTEDIRSFETAMIITILSFGTAVPVITAMDKAAKIRTRYENDNQT